MSESPWLTVVTVVRNDRAGLAATAASVAEQEAPGVELLIVDGASTDGTAELARAFAQRTEATATPALRLGELPTSAAQQAAQGPTQPHGGPAIVRVLSEPDEGIYDAMNKGWRLARAPLVHFLNAGDVYRTAGELTAVQLKVMTNPTAWLRTQVQFVDHSGAASRPVAEPRVSRRAFWWGWQPVAHQGAFMARGLLDALGGFDTSLGIVADYDLMRRCLALDVQPLIWDRVTVAVDDGGVSTQRYVQGLVEMHRSRSAGRTPGVRALSAADAMAHIGVVAGRRAARRTAERLLGVQRVRRMRGLAR